MQSHLAPSVTPRPMKKGANNNNNSSTNNEPGKPLGSPASRAGRTYTPSVSPIKPPQRGGRGNPFSLGFDLNSPNSKADIELIRPAEAPSPPSKYPPGLRKKPIILSGDIRNLGSNFDIAMSKVQVTLAHVVSAFARYGIAVANDEAQTLLYEYEENNDTGLAYDAFVDELVQLLRQTALNKTGTNRTQIKKIRLTHHLEKLSTMHARIVHQLETLLGERLRVSWTTVRDTFRSADSQHKGQLPKHVFANLCRELQIPVPSTVLEGLVLRGDPRSEGIIDYNDFLTYFGTDFQHSDPNSVSNSLMFERGVIAGKMPSYGIGDGASSASVVNNTLYSPGVSSALGGKSKKVFATATTSPSKAAMATDPLYMEQLRIVLNEKIAARYSDVKKAFLALDKDGNGLMSATEFTRVLQNFNLVVSQDETDALMAHFDMNRDGVIDYNEFFARFGDVIKPSAAVIKKNLQENSSLVFTGHKDVKGANKNRLALSSPGNELKEAFSRLSDESWRAIYVELKMSDQRNTGLVASAELLRVLAKYLGDLPKKSFSVLFRTCGSHVNQFMSYRTLVKSYRQNVMDPVEFFQQDVHVLTEKTFRKSPTESLVMIWSIRVQRAQMSAAEWQNLKEMIWKADARRQGRVLATEFKPILHQLMRLLDDQVAFLCFFYEDKNLASDHVLIRYSSFLTDYEDPGLESSSSSDGGGGSSKVKKAQQPRAEDKGRPRPPHGGGGPHAIAFTDANKMERNQEEKRLRDFFQLSIRSLDELLANEDQDKKGFVALGTFYKLCKELNGGKWKETVVSTAFFSKYVSQSHLFYYRGFLLDFDQKAGLQAQGLMSQDGDDHADEDCGDEDGDRHGDQLGFAANLMDVYQARDTVRHHLTSNVDKQKVTYKLFQRMDPGKSGLLTYPELRRVLERLEINVDDATARELLSQFEDEDAQGNRRGRVKYLQFLHAHGGRDPDKIDGMSDLSSNCSYYSAIIISPRPAMRNHHVNARPTMSRDHVVAANAVANAVEKPRMGGGGGLNNGAAAAATVERKIKSQLEAQGKTKWKQVVRAFQQIDSDRRGSVTASSFRKVFEEFGVLLDQEEIVRLQLKYDIEQNGRIHYYEYLRHLTNSMSDLSTNSNSSGGNAELLPSLSIGGNLTSPRKNGANGNGGSAAASSSGGGIPDALRQGVKAKWKAVYSSFKTLDKLNLGRVSTAHFRQLLEWYALPMSDETFLNLLRQFDHEEDACVDYNKFMRTCFG